MGDRGSHSDTHGFVFVTQYKGRWGRGGSRVSRLRLRVPVNLRPLGRVIRVRVPVNLLVCGLCGGPAAVRAPAPPLRRSRRDLAQAAARGCPGRFRVDRRPLATGQSSESIGTLLDPAAASACRAAASVTARKIRSGSGPAQTRRQQRAPDGSDAGRCSPTGPGGSGGPPGGGRATDCGWSLTRACH